MVAASKERVVEVERFGELRLPLGGKYGYIGVRGKQGPDKEKYQGYTKDKKHSPPPPSSLLERLLLPSRSSSAISLPRSGQGGKKKAQA